MPGEKQASENKARQAPIVDAGIGLVSKNSQRENQRAAPPYTYPSLTCPRTTCLFS